jgi:hypothetical protein
MPQSVHFASKVRGFVSVAGLCLLAFLPLSGGAVSLEPSPLEAGYRQMYNLDFDSAHKTFQSWEQSHPSDPLGPVSNAAAYLFSEFDRLHILDTELFTDDEKFQNRNKPTPDLKARDAFQRELARAQQIAGQALARFPQDRDALFAQAMAGGLQGDYAAMIEKRNFAGLNYMKGARSQAEKLVSLDPSYYDAYLAAGVENYLLSLKPAPLRWFLRITGARTDKKQGIDQIRITAEKGHYLAPYARLLLAVAALRDKDRLTAHTLLAGLAQEFPQNRLYRKELARLQP